MSSIKKGNVQLKTITDNHINCDDRKMLNGNSKQAPAVQESSKGRHILSFTKKDKKRFLDSFDFILSDCDGVVWLLIEPIPGVAEGVMELKNAGKTFKFISNNSMRTDEDYLAKFKQLGVTDMKPADLVHPVKTITRYLNRNMFGLPVYSLCCEKFNQTLVQNGIQLIAMDYSTPLKEDNLLAKLKPQDKVAAVIIDLNFNITYGQLALAHQYLMDDNCSLLVGASDTYVPVSKDFVTIGSAGFINILRNSSGKEPVILGKPGSLLGADVLELFQIKNPRRVLFIGDSLFTDIPFATLCGFQSLFVLSGTSTKEEMMALAEKSRPDYIADSMADFVEFFEELKTE